MINQNIQNKVLSICIKVISPIVFIFGFYIQFHGEVSPGGGFQSGTVFSVPFIVYILLYGNDTKFGCYLIDGEIFRKICGTGLLLYFFTGAASFAFGGEFLQYNSFFPENEQLGHQVGVFLVEIGVSVTIFGGMMTIFTEFYKFAIKESEKSSI